jgi:hypothetical protein
MIRRSILFVLSLLLPVALSAQQPQVSAQAFVQAFYDWYVPLTQKGEGVPGSERVFKERLASFSPRLVKAIREDSAAQAKVSDEIVGLDGDAFLMCQDFADKYVVGDMTRKGASCFVKVYGIWDGVRNTKPDVVAELLFQKGHWIFVNFYGSDGVSLLSTLAELKAERKKLHP